MSENIVGTVRELSRFPVKSMLGEQPESVTLTDGGVVGDRGYALVDADTGKVVSAKQPRLWGQMFQCRASYVEEPAAGASLPPVRIGLPGGASVTTDDPGVDAMLSELFGRPVRLATSAPKDFTIDDYHPQVEGLGPNQAPGTTTEEKLGAAFFAEAGLPSAVPEGAFVDLFPVSVLTTSTLAQLAEHKPDSVFDARRFRMNIVIDTTGTGFVENDWLGHQLTFGDGAALVAMIPDPRCVMTTLAQGDLPKDNGILQTAARHNRLDVAGAGQFPCVGVYAVVTSGGSVRRGAQVSLA